MIKRILIVGFLVVLFVAAVAVFQTICEAQAAAQVEQEWQRTRVARVQDLGTTRSLEILPLFEEAKAREDLELEHGVSYLVKTDHQNILLDVGTTPARLSYNMRTLGVSEKDFDVVFVTHLHPDHIGGMNAWWTNTLTAGDPSLDLRDKRVYLPLPMNAGGATIVASQPTKIAEGVGTAGAISFADLFPFSLRSPLNAEETLAVNVEGEGIVLIMGCGHPTVERIVARAQAASDAPIIGVVGGLHYEGFTREQAQPHIAFIKALKPQLVAVSPHDSSPAAIQAFRDAFPNAYQTIQVGSKISFGEQVEAHAVR